MVLMSDYLHPREAGKYIAQNSKDVKINQDAVKKLARKLADTAKSGEYDIKVWCQHPLHPKTADQAAVDWVFLVDTLNFSFWTDDKDKYTVTFKDQKYSGYWALCAAVNRALQEGIPITDPKYYSQLTRDQLAHILRTDSEKCIPLIDERLNVLREAGKILIEKFNGSFLTCLNQCESSAQKLLQLVVENFSSYRDVAEFEGKKVALYKRAQILIADLWGCCQGEGYAAFTDIDTITMFADYRVPQALVYFGVLQYSDELLKLLKKGVMFQSGDRLEVEIRGCSIWGIELVCEEIKKIITQDPVYQGIKMNSVLTDFYLWDFKKSHEAETKHIPMHKIRCIYY